MIREIIEQVDSIISKEEEELIRLANKRYELALKAAVKEFEALTGLGPDIKFDSESAHKIINKALDAFNEEYEKLTEPIQKAMLKSYDLGLKETGKIIEESEERDETK
jgi:predicted nucleic acid-binding protein